MPRPIWIPYLLVTLALTGASIVAPSTGMTAFLIHVGINASVVVALALGIRWHRPDPRAPWLVLLGGYAALLAANVADPGSPDEGSTLAERPLASALYLASYLALGLGFLLVARVRGVRRDWRALVDALIVGLGLFLVWFTWLVAPEIERLAGQAVDPSVFAYPLPDLAYLVLLLWFLFASGPRSVALWLLLGGILAQAGADALLGIEDAGIATEGVVEPLWLVSLALVGSAALHPSMARIAAQGDQDPWAPAFRRVWLVGAVFLLVGLSVGRDLIDRSPAGVISAGIVALLIGLAFVRLRGLVTDVVVHTRTEAALRTSERRLEDLSADLERQVIERTQALVATSDDLRHSRGEAVQARSLVEGIVATVPGLIFRGRIPDGSLDYVSPNADRFLGWTPEETMAHAGFWSDLIHPDDRGPFQAAVMADLEAGVDPSTHEYRARHRDGEYRWVLSTVRYLRDESGRPTAFVGTALDISDRKAAEDEARQAEEEAERANRAKSEFLSSASHELRTPMNVILGFAQLLGRAELRPDERESVEQILRAGRQLLGMVNNLLDLARVDARELTLSIEPVEVVELVHEAVDLVRPMAVHRDIRLVLRDGADPSPWVLADRRAFRQVMLNLLVNAVTFNRDSGEIQVSHATDDAGLRLRVSVTDTGSGIPPEHLDHLFEIFDRRNAERPTHVGLGIGLALAARLTRAMGGTIDVQSELGVGSTFSIELPIAAEPAVVVPGDIGSAPVRSHQATILYVEDNLGNLRLVERILSARPGMRLLAAMQGRLGIELARDHRPDLVLLDWHLPDIQGDEVLRRLQEEPSTRSIPVILMTSAPRSGLHRQLQEVHPVVYLEKPIDPALFLDAVDHLLDREPTDA